MRKIPTPLQLRNVGWTYARARRTNSLACHSFFGVSITGNVHHHSVQCPLSNACQTSKVRSHTIEEKFKPVKHTQGKATIQNESEGNEP